MIVARKVPIRNGYILQVMEELTHSKIFIFDLKLIEYISEHVVVGDYIFIADFTIWDGGVIGNTIIHNGVLLQATDRDWSNEEMNDCFYAIEE